QFLTERSDARIGNSTAGEAVKAIVSFRDQLAARGIRLLVMPVPNKESVYPEKLSRRAGESPGVIAKDTQGILDGLRAAGVEVVDLFALFNQCKSADNKDPIYLARDSHWSPFGVELAAKAVADCILKKAWLEAGNSEYETKSVSVRRTGDVLRMLQVPSLERNIPADTIVCKQVVNCDSRQVYQDDPRSDVLVLGDSFLRIYETDEPGSAGFIAHLAKELGRSLSSIVNDGGASTLVRQELCRRPGLLLGKKLVIWEFVERDIRLGTEGWQLVQLPSLENSRQ
ncbi:MAG TPA: hypothetical protein VEC99_12935, partial [Clostridia bacterium]|nr:hypothetical protein [Clostridia bacterium]